MKYILGLFLTILYLSSQIEAQTVVYPKCMKCKVYAISKDGTLWGWENNNYCRIRKKSCGYATATESSASASSSKTTTNKVTVVKKTTKLTTTKRTKKSTSKVATNNKEATKVKPTTNTTTATITTFETDAQGNKICNGCVVTATGGSNDLWGWESETSCIIDLKKCEGKIDNEKAGLKDDGAAAANHKKDSQGNFICNGCDVTATGSEGVSLWGWEDNASCIIDNVKCNISVSPKTEKPSSPLLRGQDGILICSTCEYTLKMEDTTLWNEENGEKCRVIGSRCNINTTPHPWCTGCIVTGTGADGALYGWEMQASCLINEISCGLYVPGENDPQDPRFAKTNNSYNNNKDKKGFVYLMVTLIILLITQLL
jgi:hypothetical protein